MSRFRPRWLAALAGLTMLAPPLAAQLTGPADPSGTYMLAVTPVGANCPRLYPNAQVILQQQSPNEVRITIAGGTTTLLYERDRASLQGIFSGLWGDTPVAVSGSVDEYQGLKALNLNLRWTGIDCNVSAVGGLEGQSQLPGTVPAAPGNVATAENVPPATVIGPAGSEKTKGAPAGDAASAEAPATMAQSLRETPFALKLALVAFAAILLGWLLGRWLGRRGT